MLEPKENRSRNALRLQKDKDMHIIHVDKLKMAR